jgi:hypothetical protein
MPPKPKYGTEALNTAERSRLFRQRSVDRKRATAELILVLLSAAPAAVRTACEQSPVFGPLISNAHNLAGHPAALEDEEG